MLITRKSPLTGIVSTRDLNITEEQIKAYNSGSLIQTAFPNLSPSDREFYKTGYTEADWEKMFPKDDNEELEE